MSEAVGERNAIVAAALWMTGGIVCFSSMAVAARALQPDLNTFEIMFYRSVIGMLIVFAIGAKTQSLGEFRLSHPGLHFLRNICHFTGQNLWLYALTLIPLAHVFALEFTSPLWVALLAPFVLAEPLTGRRALASLLGFIGILIITRPDPSNLNPGHVAAAIAAIGFAGSAIATKRLTRSVPTLAIIFWMTVFQLFFGLGTCLANGRLLWPSIELLPSLIILSIAALLAHYCLTRALSLAPATIVFPIDFMRLPLIMVVGALFYDESLEAVVFFGAFIIFSANWLNLRSNNRPKTA